MDWKLTKSLYILVFLLINIALLMMYYNKQQEDVREIENTPSILEETDIDISNIPEHEPEKLNIVSGQRIDFTEVDDVDEDTIETSNDGQVLHYVFEEGDLVPEMEETALEEHKNEQVYRGSNYQYDDVMSDEGYMLFNQYYEDFPIFNHEAARLLYRGDGAEPEEYEQGFLTNLSENSYTSPIAVRNPRQCVTDLYLRDRISGEAVIEHARLGYYVILSDEDQVLLRPKWEFQVMDQGIDKTIYIDAISETEDIIESE